MAIRNAQKLTFQGTGVCDSIDGTNAAPGSLLVCTDLVPNPSTAGTFVSRPAATRISASNLVGTISALIVVGTRAYGMASSGTFVGYDVPFCYDLVNNTLVAIGNVVAGSLPASPTASGDWVPPQLAMVANRVLITHPGFDGVTCFVGWIDMRGYTYAAGTGSTHTSTVIDTLSFNPWLLDVMPGDKITGAGIPAGTYIVATTATSLTLSRATVASAAGVALTITSGTSAAPLWGSGQMSGNVQFSSVPTHVQQFNGRAYYAVDNAVIGSDSLIPLQTTGASPLVLVLGDSAPITALGGLPLSSQLVGGVIQSIIAFKGGGLYYQITGDPATNNLAVNAVEGSVGTIAPNSVAATPLGLAYIAPDGLRIIGLDGKSSEPLGADGKGVAVPFIYAVSPTRIAAAYNQNVLRISVQNGSVNGQPQQEWWYHFTRGLWTGPHSFPAALIAPYYNGAINTFILAPQSVAGSFWRSDAVPGLGSTYTENGLALSFAYQTALLPDNQQAAMNQVAESSQAFALPGTMSLSVLAQDEAGVQLGLVTVAGAGNPGTLWGAFNWGAKAWGASLGPFRQVRLPWPAPLVFKQLSLRVTGQSMAGFVLGNIYSEYQILRYLLP